MEFLGIFAKKENIWLNLAGVIVLVAVTGAGLASAHSSTEIYFTLVLMILFGIAYTRMPDPDGNLSKDPKPAFLYLAILTLIAGGAALFLAQVFTVLFFVTSVGAMLLLPTRPALMWIALFTIIAAAAHIMREGWVSGLLTALINGTAFVFFGAFGQALSRAKSAEFESRQLLGELQSAHQQLQAYAQKVEGLAIAEERNRLSRDLHDTLGHRLTASLVQLEGAERLISSEPQRAASMIQTVREQLNDGLSEVRQTVAMLRTPLSTDLSLPKGLKQLAHNFQQATQLRISTHLPDTLPPLSDGLRLALYRAAQEALTNVQRHAQAESVQLSLEVMPEFIALKIEDDGIGISSEQSQNGGFGLRGMRERARQLDGDLLISTSQGGGTQITFTLPRTVSNDSLLKTPYNLDEQEAADGAAEPYPRLARR